MSDDIYKVKYFNQVKNKNMIWKSICLNKFKLFQILTTISLIIVLCLKMDWLGVYEVFLKVIWYWVAVSVLMFVFAIYIQTIRWRILLQEQKICLSTKFLFKRLWYAHFTNKFLPSSVGGDFVRIFFPWGRKVDKIAITSSIIVDRLSGIAGLLILMTAVGFINYKLLQKLGYQILPIISFACVSFLLLLLLTISPLSYIKSLFGRLPFANISQILERLVSGIILYRDKKRTIICAVLISITMQSVWGLCNYFAFLTFNLSFHFGNIFFITILINIISLIPISINGWGFREGIYVLLFGQIGVTSAESLSVALLGRILGYGIPSAAMLIYLIFEKYEVYELKS